MNEIELFIKANSYPQEEWREIIGTKGLYYVSSFGRILSLQQKKPRLKVPQEHYRGYYTVDLYIEGYKHRYFIHRLVAHTYLDNDDKKQFVHHKDGNKHNNHIDNLQWVTPKENSQLYQQQVGIKGG